MAVQRSKYTVLLVIDNDAATLQAYAAALAQAGYRVTVAENRAHAVELFRSQHVDLVVTDQIQPRFGALKLAASMKRLKPNVPIFALYAPGETPTSAAHADRCIQKTRDADDLVRTVDQMMVDKTTKLTVARQTRVGSAKLPPQALLAAIVEDSTDAILSKTLDGVITSWNHAAEVMYGYTKEEAIGAPITMLLAEDRADEVKNYLVRLAHGERITNLETIRVAKGGRKLTVLLTISPIRDQRGRVIGASSIARDITDQKRAEEALRKAERLATAGRMAAIVAHEINNPLESAGNILYLLRNMVELSDEARKLVEIASQELERATEITELTLGMQRGSSRNTVPLEVTTLIDNVLTLYKVRAKELGIEVVRRYDDRGITLGFPVELQQVFSNLIVNAMDALATNGNRLVLSVRRTRNLSTGDLGVRVSVLDNGPGIAPEHASHVFEPFYTTKGEQGTGIGLWVSRNIVEKHGGSMRMHTSVRPGRAGTCFSVFLPLRADVLSKAA
jgi:two-component system, chemotaxis family, CheB/CheR fusion protein